MPKLFGEKMEKIRIKFPFRDKEPVSQLFGARPEVYKHYGFAGHEGVDFAVPVGMPVVASADGQLWRLGSINGAYGIRAIVRHQWGSTIGFTIYAHLSKTQGAELDHVKAGDVIGYSGNTGNSTGPHLHWSLCLPFENKGYAAPLGVSRRVGYPTIKLWYFDPFAFVGDV